MYPAPRFHVVVFLAALSLPLHAVSQEKDAGPLVAAWSGTPLGVGKIVVPLAELDGKSLPVLRESSSRALYVATSRVDEKIRRVANFYFLFCGDDPLTLDLPGLLKEPLTVRPKANDAEHRLEKARWWEAFRQVLEREPADGGYPPVVQ